jgi:hypothetical protein
LPTTCISPAFRKPSATTPAISGTCWRIRGALAGLAARSDAESSVVIYLSGHGARVTSGAQAGEYILPADAVLTSAEHLASTAISGAELAAALETVPAAKALVVFGRPGPGDPVVLA